MSALLDQREEVCVIGLCRAAADGEADIEHVRVRLCENVDFEPYATFKALQSRPLTSGILTAKDVYEWFHRQWYKSTMLTQQQVENVFNLYAQDGLMRYENFLKMVLPKQDKTVRSLVMCRRTVGTQLEKGEVPREVGYQFIRLLEQESSLYDELVIRKKRLAEYEWKEGRKHLPQRSFSWLQSMSAVPGVSHVSVLGVNRLLVDAKAVMSSRNVENMFFRINTSGTDMLSSLEWNEFLASKEADEHLNELYVKLYTTQCPDCGSMCQREGGACPNVTCAFCRCTFTCNTRSETRAEARGKGNNASFMVGNFGYTTPRGANTTALNSGVMTSPRAMASPRSAGRYPTLAREAASYDRPQLSGRVGSAFSPSPRGARGGIRGGVKGKMDFSTTSLLADAADRTLSTALPDDSMFNDTSMSMVKSPTGNDLSLLSRSLNMSPISPEKSRIADLLEDAEGVQNESALSKMGSLDVGKKLASMRLVVDVMLQQVALDAALEAHKEAFWETGISSEAIFAFLDRYNKGFVADTDIWQVMHVEATPGPVSFSGVCALFRENKMKDAKKPGQFNLAELTKAAFPMYSEESFHVSDTMRDSETKNVLYILRHTTKCPGCAARVQRTVEGCPQVTCPYCTTHFRCHNFADQDDDKLDRLTLSQKYALRKLLKHAVETAEDHEQLRKSLATCGFAGDSLSSILLDAFLMMSEDKGYLSFEDVKMTLLREKALKPIELEMVWARYAGTQRKLGFGDFATQLRPFGLSV